MIQKQYEKQNNLKHVGILGMKWGIRRRGPTSSDFTTARTLKKKHVSELSNDEIKKVVTRLSLEKQLKDIDSANINRGRNILSNILRRVGPVLVNVFINRHRNQTPSDDSTNSTEGEVIDVKLLEDKNR